MNHTVPNNCWRTRNYGKVTGDEGWDGEAVTWCVSSWPGSMMGTAAVLIDGNTSAMDPSPLG